MAAPLGPLEIDALVIKHGLNGLYLSSQADGVLHGDGDPQALVFELLRLARLGALVEAVQGQALSLDLVQRTAITDWAKLQGLA